MSEVEKLYELAGIELISDVKFPTKDVNYNVSYPPFTAEKQIKLIKWCLDNYRGYIFDSIETEWFEEQLCAFINDIWQDLTSEEKEALRGILRA